MAKKRTTQLVEYDGRKQSVLEWSKETGLSEATIRQRLNAYKWSPERALTTAPHEGRELATEASPAAQLREGFISLALKAFHKNRKACLAALDEAFRTDPLKTMQTLEKFIPKEAIEKARAQEKAVVRIEFNGDPPKNVTFSKGDNGS